MSRLIATGKQSFFNLRVNNCFYVDKTKFIREWWKGLDDVTILTRPRRFGKTLMLDTVKTFFSLEFAGRSDLFEGLEIWKDEEFRNLQGKIPVIFLSFADIKSKSYDTAIKLINSRINRIYKNFRNFLNLDLLLETEKIQFASVNNTMELATAQDSLLCLSEYLVSQGYSKPIILLDEYDTPLQEAWMNHYWDDLIAFIRGFFNTTFKTNPYLGRALISGITRVAKESIFSDLNNLKVVSLTSDLYADCFGFTAQEVFSAMDEYELTNKEEVKSWYDGFIFGNQKEIYNPWSIINFLSTKILDTYWADTSSNSLVSDLLAHSDINVKEETEDLLSGKSLVTYLDEQIDFSRIYTDKGAIWSLLMSAGYVKPLEVNRLAKKYKLEITNYEAKFIIEKKIFNWFKELRISERNNFIQALLEDEIGVMNELMSEIAESTFSFFDTKISQKKGRREAENFYHGFVLGLIINLKERYSIISNRESGFGRYDICMYPKNLSDHGIVIEFKSIKLSEEENLEATCASALKQIKEKDYIKVLLVHNVAKSNIYVYGFAFQGKKVLILGGAYDSIDWDSIMKLNDGQS